METESAQVTAADYLAATELPPCTQLIQGRLVQDPSPDLGHQLVLGRLYLLLAGFVEQRSLGQVILAPMDVVLTDTDVFQPDLLFVSKEKRNQLSRRGVQGAPDLVIEILSPSTAQRDLNYKSSVYAGAGVQEAWFPDLERRTVTIYRYGQPGERSIQLAAGTDRISSHLLPGFETTPDSIFGGIGDWA